MDLRTRAFNQSANYSCCCLCLSFCCRPSPKAENLPFPLLVFYLSSRKGSAVAFACLFVVILRRRRRICCCFCPCPRFQVAQGFSLGSLPTGKNIGLQPLGYAFLCPPRDLKTKATLPPPRSPPAKPHPATQHRSHQPPPDQAAHPPCRQPAPPAARQSSPPAP